MAVAIPFFSPMTPTGSPLLAETLRGLVVAGLGGIAFWLAGFPVPWLAGAMVAGAAAALAGMRIGLAPALRDAAFVLLGVQTGAAVDWQTVERAVHWPLSVVLLCLTVAMVTLLCAAYYRRVHGWDRATAFFASLPGALSLVILLAGQSGADIRRVAVAQCIRLFLLVAAIPALIEFSVAVPQASGLAPIEDWGALAVVIGVSWLAGLALERLRFPAGLYVGPMLAATVASLSGLASGAVPDLLLVPGNIVLGLLIAARFGDFSLAEVGRSLVQGLSGFLVALAVTLAGAMAAGAVTGLPLALTLLAFAPGGLEAMTMIAFALNYDLAYVGSHHVIRYLGMVLVVPLIAVWMARSDPPGDSREKDARAPPQV